jgi:hypothetical protein
MISKSKRNVVSNPMIVKYLSEKLQSWTFELTHTGGADYYIKLLEFAIHSFNSRRRNALDQSWIKRYLVRN